MARIEVQANGCWECTFQRDEDGYARVKDHGKKRGAHVVVAEYHYGSIVNGQVVMHVCDNPPCVNPSHLRVGTHQDNEDDKRLKGREFVPRGTLHGNAKLDEKKIQEIRKLLNAGTSQREIAKQFDISQSLVSLVNRNARWKHLLEEQE